MKAKLTIVMEQGNVKMPLLEVDCKDLERLREVFGAMVSGSICMTEVSDAYCNQIAFRHKVRVKKGGE